MAWAAFDPHAALRSMFGASLEGPLAEIVVRNWGALITLVGAMLVYGALRPAVRPLVVAVAAASKLVFISLVLAYGRAFLGGSLGVSIAVDATIVVVFIAWLAGTRRRRAEPPGLG